MHTQNEDMYDLPSPIDSDKFGFNYILSSSFWIPELKGTVNWSQIVRKIIFGDENYGYDIKLDEDSFDWVRNNSKMGYHSCRQDSDKGLKFNIRYNKNHMFLLFGRVVRINSLGNDDPDRYISDGELLARDTSKRLGWNFHKQGGPNNK